MKRLLATSAVLGASGFALFASGPANGQQGQLEVVAVEGLAEGLFVDVDSNDPPPQEARINGLRVGTDSGPAPAGVQVAMFGPAPRVEVGPEAGGPLTDSLANVTVPWEVDFSFAAAEVSTNGTTGPDGTVVSGAQLLGADLANITADEFASRCDADVFGATGTTTISNGSVFGEFDLPENPAPNTVLTSAEIPNLVDNATITLNEQQVVQGPDGPRIEVTAIHLVAAPNTEDNPIGEFYASRVVCGVSIALVPVPVPVEPTFTG